MASEDERVLENLLDLQLQEQRDSLATLNDALVSDPTNPELRALQGEVIQAIKDAEEGLLHLKRARLLREVDSALGPSQHANKDVKAEPLDPTESLDEPCYSVGSKCRFLHSDGRWYNGQIIGLDAFNTAKVAFLNPTSENMLICKFFLQQRCRFGSNCCLSHGVDVPLSSLKMYTPTVWVKSLVGSRIWALSDGEDIVWRKAELESWDGLLGVGRVVFQDDGSSANLGEEALTLSEFAQITDEEDSSSEQSDYSEFEDDAPQGLGFLESTLLQRGIQTETAIFAKWENHTRGIASKMMANMGYLEGTGLGASGQGIVDPISVKVLPPKQSLDHAVESSEKEEGEGNQGKKRGRGGKRKRDKKFAALTRTAKEVESTPDMFSFINSQLAMHGKALNGGSAKKQQNKGSGEGKKVNRRDLVAYEEEVKELKIRVGKLEEMVSRNKKEKVIYEAAMRKLIETRKALAEAETAQASASNSVVSREKEKRWLKF
ncbi:zinc finger CCCH domain-containing protein 22 [Argentina anserina]|uniref:zinc finger CCCH domain-containing protein 22 n=1 Tax=Argentina anserina TaxID=57926 RepID=UPI0021767F33|nr:zinc finger CCCH domain-containing protein 22 [Potentilla anserina]